MKRPEITINGQHRYVVEGVNLSPKTGKPLAMSSCSTIADHIDTYSGGLVDWAAKLAIEYGDPKAHKIESQKSKDIGTALHEEINHYIVSGTAPKDSSKLFNVWFSYMREEFGIDEYLASEYVLFHPVLEYGGTVDALAMAHGEVTIFDWKTHDELKGDGSLKTFVPLDEAVQLGGYYDALSNQPIEWYEEVVGKGVKPPTKGYIINIYKDTLRAEKREVNLPRAAQAFQYCQQVHKSKGGLYV
jgi:hypothetical protein